MSIVVYGIMVSRALAAAEELAAEGIDAEVIDLRTVSPWDKETVLASIKKTGRVVVAHEAVKQCGFGAELSATIAEEALSDLKGPIVRIGAPFVPIPMTPHLEDLCRTADEDGSTFCVAMADIDNFKQFNDQYGHGHGDLVLISVADCIRTCVRETDSVCRWGGEEIVITFFNASSDTAREVLQSIRRELHALTAQGRPPFFREVTLTFGLAQHGLGQSAQELMSEADRLLYKGKQEGKNCIME